MTETPESFFDEVLSAFDQAFDAATGNDSKQSPEYETAHSEISVDGNLYVLFADIAAEYAKPLKTFIFQLQRGIATQDWLDFCLPLTDHLEKASRQIELNEVSERLVCFATVLQECQHRAEPYVTGKPRADLLDTFSKLVEVMPRTFEIDQPAERENLMLQLLLGQIKGVGPATLKKLRKADRWSFQCLLDVKPETLAHESALPLRVTKQMQKSIREYQVRTSALAPDLFQAELRAQLTRFAMSLMKKKDTKSRKSRKASLASWQDATIILAELGEMKWVTELSTLVPLKRAARLAELLKETES